MNPAGTRFRPPRLPRSLPLPYGQSSFGPAPSLPLADMTPDEIAARLIVLETLVVSRLSVALSHDPDFNQDRAGADVAYSPTAGHEQACGRSLAARRDGGDGLRTAAVGGAGKTEPIDDVVPRFNRASSHCTHSDSDHYRRRNLGLLLGTTRRVAVILHHDAKQPIAGGAPAASFTPMPMPMPMASCAAKDHGPAPLVSVVMPAASSAKVFASLSS